MKVPLLLPKVGMGITIQLGSDRYAGTITRVTKARFFFQRDHATRTDHNGQSEVQDYAYRPNPQAPERCAYLTDRDGWREMGRGGWITLGERQFYRDPGF